MASQQGDLSKKMPQQDQETPAETVMSAQKKTPSIKAVIMPKGDCEPNLNPPIQFILPKRDIKGSQPTVEIMILENPKKKAN
jgi:hypothetical protein